MGSGLLPNPFRLYSALSMKYRPSAIILLFLI